MDTGRKFLLLVGLVMLSAVAATISAGSAAVADNGTVTAQAASLTARARLPMVSNDTATTNPSSAAIDSGGQGAATTGQAGVVSLSDSTREYQISVASDVGPLAGIRVGVIVRDGTTIVVANDPAGRYLPTLASFRTSQNLRSIENLTPIIKFGLKLIDALDKFKGGASAVKVGKDLGLSGLELSLSDIQPYSTGIPFVGGTAISKCLTPEQLVAATEAAFFAGGIVASLAITFVSSGTTAPLIPIMVKLGVDAGGGIVSYLLSEQILKAGQNYTVKVGLLRIGLVGLSIPFIEIVKDNCGKPLPPSSISMSCPSAVVLGAQIHCSAGGENVFKYTWLSTGGTVPAASGGFIGEFSTTTTTVGTVTIRMHACGVGGDCSEEIYRDVVVRPPATPTPSPSPSPTQPPAPVTRSVTVQVNSRCNPGIANTGCDDLPLPVTLNMSGFSRQMTIVLKAYQNLDDSLGTQLTRGTVTFSGVPVGTYTIQVPYDCFTSGAGDFISCIR